MHPVTSLTERSVTAALMLICLRGTPSLTPFVLHKLNRVRYATYKCSNPQFSSRRAFDAFCYADSLLCKFDQAVETNDIDQAYSIAIWAKERLTAVSSPSDEINTLCPLLCYRYEFSVVVCLYDLIKTCIVTIL